MKNILQIIQIISAVLISVSILSQSKGTGFGRSNSSFTRRGLEKVVFRATFVLVAIFIAVSILLLVI